MKTEWMPAPPKNWQELKPHPLASIVEFGTGIDISAMAAHMRQHGFDPNEAIVIYQGMVLDGRHRLPAAIEAGVEPTFRMFVGDNPLAYVAKKIHRQHLTTSQRAMLAARIVSGALPSQAEASGQQHHGQVSSKDAAQAMGVSTRAVVQAVAVQNNGTPEVRDAVVDGSASVSDAAAVAQEPPKKQRRAVRLFRSGKAKTLKEAVASEEPELEEDLSASDLMDRKNGEIESFCRKLAALVKKEMPKDKWIDYKDKGSAFTQHISNACALLRTAKCHSECPMCDGDGCDKCLGTGRVPRSVFDLMGKK